MVETGSTMAAEERRLPPLSHDELARLPIVSAGTPLETSGVYIDVNHLVRGPFKALAGQEAGSSDRYVARRDVDHELWNRLVEQAPAEGSTIQAEHPTSGAESVEAQYERS